MRGKTLNACSIVALILLLGSLLGASLGQPVHAAQVVASPTGTPTGTDTPTRTPTTSPTSTPNATFTPFAPAHLVISELRSRGPNGADDEFVELFNPTGAEVGLAGWSLGRSSGCGTGVETMLIFPDYVSLLGGQSYLAVSSTNSSLTGADQDFTPGLEDDGGVALLDPAGQVVDQVGMCVSTQYREGLNLAPLIGNADQSYERLPGSATACYDTNNNASDFVLISPPNPQNSGSPITLCGGVVLSTVTYTPTFTPSVSPTRTITVTRTPTRTPRQTAIPNLVVLNEFLPHPLTDWNVDGVINEGDEYIEIRNLSPYNVNITNWELVDGANSPPYTLPALSLVPGQILVFFHFETGLSLPDSGGTVRLVKADRRTADNFHYPPVEAADRTWCRLPDRSNGNLAYNCRPSPGQPNLPFNPSPPTPGSTPAPGVESVCALADTVPPAMAVAECSGFGAGISNAALQDRFWLPVRGKWELFVE